MSHPPSWKQQLAGMTLAAATALTASAVWAKGPSLSGPSIAAASSVVVLDAKSLPLGGAVTVAVTDPSGREAHYAHVASAEGTLSINVKIGAAGRYQVRLLDSGGRELSSTMLIAQ